MIMNLIGIEWGWWWWRNDEGMTEGMKFQDILLRKVVWLEKGLKTSFYLSNWMVWRPWMRGHWFLRSIDMRDFFFFLLRGSTLSSFLSSHLSFLFFSFLFFSFLFFSSPLFGVVWRVGRIFCDLWDVGLLLFWILLPPAQRKPNQEVWKLKSCVCLFNQIPQQHLEPLHDIII